MEKRYQKGCSGYWKFFLLLYLAGFGAGIVFTNLVWKYRLQDLEALTAFRFQTNLDTAGTGYLWYLIRKRCGSLLVWHVLGLTAAGSYAAAAGAVWAGFLGGILSAAAILQLGLTGIGLLAAASFPQAVLYAPAGLFYLSRISGMSARCREGIRITRKKYKEYLLACGAGISIILCGVMLEYYVNPYFMSMFFRT